MPFRSKAQMKRFLAMEARGEIPKGTSKRWAEETRSLRALPLKARSKRKVRRKRRKI